jgi:hypothetical protein
MSSRRREALRLDRIQGVKMRAYLAGGSSKPVPEEAIEKELDRLEAERKPATDWLEGVVDACED